MSEKVNVSFEDLDSAISNLASLDNLLNDLQVRIHRDLLAKSESSGKCADVITDLSKKMIDSVVNIRLLEKKTEEFLIKTKETMEKTEDTVAACYREGAASYSD